MPVWALWALGTHLAALRPSCSVPGPGTAPWRGGSTRAPDLRTRLTFVAGHAFLPPRSFPRAEVALGLAAPAAACATAGRRGLFTDVSP